MNSSTRAAAALLALAIANPASATLIIDDFSTDQSRTGSSGDVSGTGIVGGARTFVAGEGEFEVTGGQARFITQLSSSDTFNSVFRGFLNYGGIDGTSDLNLDLSSFASTGGILFDVASLGNGADFDPLLTIRLVTAGTGLGSTAQPEFTASGAVLVPFSSFFQGGPNGLADMSDIDWISFDFTSSAQVGGPQFTLNSISVVPEPSACLCFLAISVVVGSARSRRSRD
ncbi:MAG: hypothetical protein AAFV43_07685 [Planctomycetota bacterium]